MDIAAFVSFAVLVLAWLALPLRTPRVELMGEEQQAA